MTAEELLKPRYKVIAGWPDNEFPIETVLTKNDKINSGDWLSIKDNSLIGIKESAVIKYPNLFKKLEWWEDREKKDMPEYVKISEYPHKGEFTFIHVDGKKARHEFNSSGYFGIKYQSGGGTYIGQGEPHFLPATKEEYENQ